MPSDLDKIIMLDNVEYLAGAGENEKLYEVKKLSRKSEFLFLLFFQKSEFKHNFGTRSNLVDPSEIQLRERGNQNQGTHLSSRLQEHMHVYYPAERWTILRFRNKL